MSLRWNSNLLIPDLVGVLGFRVCGCNPCGDPPPPESIPFCDRVAFRAGPGGEVLGGDNALVATEGTAFALTVSRLPQCYRWHGTPAEFEAAAGYPAPVAEGEYYFDTAASSFWVVAEGVFEASAAPDWHGVGEIVVTWTVNRTECGCPHMVEAATGTLTWADGDVADKTITLAAPTHTGALPFWTCNGVGGGGEPFTVSLARVSSTSVGHGCGSTGVAANVVAVCTHEPPYPGVDPDYPYATHYRLFGWAGVFTPNPILGTLDNTASFGYKRRTVKEWNHDGTQTYNEDSETDEAGYYYTRRRWTGVRVYPGGQVIITQTPTLLVLQHPTTLARTEIENFDPVDCEAVVDAAAADAEAYSVTAQVYSEPGGSGGAGVSYTTGAGTPPWEQETVASVVPGYVRGVRGAASQRYDAAASAAVGPFPTSFVRATMLLDFRGCYYGRPDPLVYSVREKRYEGASPGGAHTLADTSACEEITESTREIPPPTVPGAVVWEGCDFPSPSFPPPPPFICHPGLVAP